MKPPFDLQRSAPLFLAGMLLSCASLAAAAANNPVPSVVGPVIPQAVAPGSQAFVLHVYGAGFVSGAVVNWNGKARTTTFVSARELQAQILASDVATPTAGYITVTNPVPGGGKSSSSYGLVEVHLPTAGVVVNRPKAYDVKTPVWSTVTADFNGDGILDLVAGSAGLLSLVGNGNGTFRFGALVDKGLTPPPLGMVFGDFNNDGLLDLAFTRDGSVAVLKGNGKGGFRTVGSFGNFTFVHRVVVGDFNRDGKLDLAVADSGGKVSILLGNGDGTFGAQTDYTSLEYPFDIATADFNGDGILDLAVLSNTNQGAVSIFLGNGDGTFAAPNTITLGAYVGFNSFGVTVLVNDFNNDGKSDLAILQDDKIAVLLGNGDGTFHAAVYHKTNGGGNAMSFTAGDFNSDGKTDLAISVENGHKLSVFLGNGNGTFQRLTSVLAGPGSSTGVVPGDFNSDGLLDLVLQEDTGDYVYTQQ
ncbi:MAG TPA: VCBS repeat-containing protein [Terriglobales bacterium]|nr:VCBS repeat-containing protein [Terriglobales bacterium]